MPLVLMQLGPISAKKTRDLSGYRGGIEKKLKGNLASVKPHRCLCYTLNLLSIFPIFRGRHWLDKK